MSLFDCVPRFYAHHPCVKIGNLIRREVVPYMRSLAVLSPELQQETLQRVGAESAAEFFNNLARTWKEHNAFAMEIDRFLSNHANWATLQMREEWLTEALTLFERAHRIETEKRLYTAGVKEALDKAIDQCRPRYRLSDKTLALLLGLQEPSYWSFRNGAHASWRLSQNGVSSSNAPIPQIDTSQLCKIFHSGCSDVLSERLSEPWLAKLVTMDVEALKKVVQSWSETHVDGRKRQTELGYLVIERPELKAIQNLIKYDNLTEMLFGSNLWGVPDLFLRRLTVNALVRLGSIDSRESVLMYTVDELKCCAPT